MAARRCCDLSGIGRGRRGLMFLSGVFTTDQAALVTLEANIGGAWTVIGTSLAAASLPVLLDRWRILVEDGTVTYTGQPIRLPMPIGSPMRVRATNTSGIPATWNWRIGLVSR